MVRMPGVTMEELVRKQGDPGSASSLLSLATSLLLSRVWPNPSFLSPLGVSAPCGASRPFSPAVASRVLAWLASYSLGVHWCRALDRSV